MNPAPPVQRRVHPAEALFLKETGVTRPRLALRTDMKVDTGGWLRGRKTRVWLFVTNRQIVIVAADKRRFVQKIDISQCSDSFYSHATGQLVLEPIKDVPYKHIRLTPIDANRVLDLIAEGEITSDIQPGTPPEPNPNPSDTATENSRA